MADNPPDKWQRCFVPGKDIVVPPPNHEVRGRGRQHACL
jgi:hypothetical protein